MTAPPMAFAHAPLLGESSPRSRRCAALSTVKGCTLPAPIPKHSARSALRAGVIKLAQTGPLHRHRSPLSVGEATESLRLIQQSSNHDGLLPRFTERHAQICPTMSLPLTTGRAKISNVHDATSASINACSKGGGENEGGAGSGGAEGRSGGGSFGGGGRGEGGPPEGEWPDGVGVLMSGAVAYEVNGASRRNYSRSEHTGELYVSRVNARESRGRLFEEVRLFFLPEGFPDSVGHSYAGYTCWRFLQNVISAMTAVLSTQALLSAVGIGPGASHSVAAATSWVLKDGFGSIGKLMTARMGVAFDSESKMYRLSSDILFDLGISLELLTPLFPQQFLLLAAMGNFIKSVSVTIGMACRNSVLATFVLRENLGDISAKNDAQNTIANLLGLGAGIGVARVLPERTSLRLAAFWALTSVYSLINYQSMKAVTLRTLNRQRAGIAIDEFIRGNPIPSPEYVNRHERIIPFIKPRFAEPRLRLGAPLSALEDGLESMVAEAKKHGDRFIIDLSPNQVNVVLHQDANSDDVLQAYLAYSHIRRELGNRLNDGLCRDVSIFAEKRSGCVPTAKRIWTCVDPVNRFKKLEESRQYARKNLRRLKQALTEAGYNTKTLLFAPDRTRAFY